MTDVWFVYLVGCADGSYYTGVTVDIPRRLAEHNSGPGGCRYTRSRQPVHLLAAWEVAGQSQALQAEYYIKHHLRHHQKQQLADNPYRLAELLPHINLHPFKIDA